MLRRGTMEDDLPLIGDLVRFLDDSAALKALLESPVGPAIWVIFIVALGLAIVLYATLGIIRLASNRYDELADSLAEKRIFWRWLALILAILAASAVWHDGLLKTILAGFAAVAAVAGVHKFFKETQKKETEKKETEKKETEKKEAGKEEAGKGHKGKNAVDDDDLGDVEDILRRHGIT
jgi:multisubunit Na+/H+ antiporter MnhG subunit